MTKEQAVPRLPVQTTTPWTEHHHINPPGGRDLRPASTSLSVVRTGKQCLAGSCSRSLPETEG